jgi:HAE1 family hydrophobic/amphiphilic exporter-1
MTLPELSIKRHVLAWMLSLVLVLFGIISYGRIGMDRYPYIEFPVISVSTTLKGANPDIVDASITNIIESSVNSTPGIEHIQSTSSPGISVINITFNLEKRIDVAFNEVQAKVNQVLRRLPKDVDPPIVAKVETNAQPIIWLALQGDRTQQQLNQYAINTLKKRLETIDGVGEVRLGGRRDRTIRVNLLPDRMVAMSVTAQDVTDAFNKEHVQLAGGFIVGTSTENLVKLDLEFHTLEDLKQMVVHMEGEGTDPSRRHRRSRRRPHRFPPTGTLQWRHHHRPRYRQGHQHQHGRHCRQGQGEAGEGTASTVAARPATAYRLQ